MSHPNYREYKNALRTVGCCAHVFIVLWYLGYGKHFTTFPLPASFLDNITIASDSTYSSDSYWTKPVLKLI